MGVVFHFYDSDDGDDDDMEPQGTGYPATSGLISYKPSMSRQTQSSKHTEQRYFCCELTLCYFVGSIFHTQLLRRVYVKIAFFFLHKNICCCYSLEVPHGVTFNENPQQTLVFFEKCEKIAVVLVRKTVYLELYTVNSHYLDFTYLE